MTAFIAFWVRWERVGKIIELNEFSSQLNSFDKNELTDAEVLIGKVVFGSSEEEDKGFCPSFKGLLTQDFRGVGPSAHLARLILLSEKQGRAIDYHIDSLFLACRLERDYSQDFLLDYTLSKVYLGNGEYGVKNASLSLFNKPVDQLSNIEVFEIAILIRQPNSRNNDPDRKHRAIALMERSDLIE